MRLFRTWPFNAVFFLLFLPTLALAQSNPAQALLDALNSPGTTAATSSTISTTVQSSPPPAVTTASVTAAPAATTATLSSAKAALIQSLYAEMQALEAQIATIETVHGTQTQATQTTQAPSSCTPLTFTRELSPGSTGQDVTSLQQFLVAQGYLHATPTGYFGTLTEAAAFQSSNGISSVGSVGPVTDAKIGSLSSSCTAPTPTAPAATTPTAPVAGTPANIVNYTPPAGGGGGGGGGGTSSGGSSSSAGGSSSGGGGGGTSTPAPDTTPPTISITAPASTLSSGTTLVTLSATTNEAATCVYSTGQTTPFASASTFATTGGTIHSTVISGLQSGTAYSYYIQCQDQAGNVGTASLSFSVASPPVLPIDTTPPSAPANLAASAVSTSQISLSWSASTDNVGVTGYQIFRNGGTSAIAQVTVLSYQDSSLTSSTRYTYTIKATDAAGNLSLSSNTASATTLAAPDTTPPTVSLTAPSSGATVRGTSVTLTATASDNVAVANVQFKVDGTNIGSAITSSPYTTTWNSTGVSDGSHTLSAVAEDTSGNYATSSKSVTVENTPVSISSISSGSPTTTSATITWTTNEAASSTVAYGTTTAYGKASSSLSLVTSHSITLSGLTASTTYDFQIQATNAAGNLTTSTNQTFSTAATFNLASDGSANAQSGTPQYSSLASEGGVSSYSATPPWKVAGVDYPVGYSLSVCGGSLSDPATMSIPGVTVNTSNHTITITGNNVMIKCFDFSDEGGLWTVSDDGNNNTVENSNFAVGTGYTGRTGIVNGNTNFNFLYNTMDGGCNPNSTVQNWNENTSYNDLAGAGSGVFEYNWLKNSCGDEVGVGETTTSNLIYAYNLVQNGALAAAYDSLNVHNNFIQFYGGAYTNPLVIYNNFLQTGLGGNAAYGPGEGAQFDAQGGGTIIGGTASNNVIIARPVTAQGANPGLSISYTITFHSEPGANTGGIAEDNYIDTSGAYGPFNIDNSSGSMSFSTCNGNKYMVTGTTITGTFGAATCN